MASPVQAPPPFQPLQPRQRRSLAGPVVLILLGVLLLSNAARMFWFAMSNGPSVPLAVYAKQFKELVIHGLTQKRWLECTSDTTKHWLRHVLLVTGYGTMFALVVVFLYWFQVEDASFHWTSLLGYYSTLVLLGATSWIALDRLQKKDQIHKYSDLADWLFVTLLFLTGLSGILLHLARLLNLPMPTYVMYVVHLMIAVPMLTVEVPFGKWAKRKGITWVAHSVGWKPDEPRGDPQPFPSFPFSQRVSRRNDASDHRSS